MAVRGRSRRVLFAVVAMAFVASGLLGAYRYMWTYWLYRGFSPPTTPISAVVGSPVAHRSVRVVPTTVVQMAIKSTALGGLADPVDVVLPPGYSDHPNARYPVFYLLHGAPGSPQNFLDIGNVQGVEATLVAEGRMKPMILVLPSGSPGFLIDTEWANGVQPGGDWLTFVAQDLVTTIDKRFRTIPTGNARAIGGYSEGAYGALNIAFHKVGEFHVIESWSGYMQAEHLTSVFGTNPAALTQNSPYTEAPKIAPELKSTHTFIWMYTGSQDPSAHRQTVQFAAEMRKLQIPYVSLISSGSHDWSLWRSMMSESLIAVSDNVSNA